MPTVMRTVAKGARLRKRHEDYIVMLLAGREAKELLGAFGGHKQDYIYARKYAKKWLGASSKEDFDNIIARLRVRARHLVLKKLPEVIGIAEALDKHGTLTARQVRELYHNKPQRGRPRRCRIA
jgi:hypothetical protein